MSSSIEEYVWDEIKKWDEIFFDFLENLQNDDGCDLKSAVYIENTKTHSFFYVLLFPLDWK